MKHHRTAAPNTDVILSLSWPMDWKLLLFSLATQLLLLPFFPHTDPVTSGLFFFSFTTLQFKLGWLVSKAEGGTKRGEENKELEFSGCSGRQIFALLGVGFPHAGGRFRCQAAKNHGKWSFTFWLHHIHMFTVWFSHLQYQHTHTLNKNLTKYNANSSHKIENSFHLLSQRIQHKGIWVIKSSSRSGVSEHFFPSHSSPATIPSQYSVPSRNKSWCWLPLMF